MPEPSRHRVDVLRRSVLLGVAMLALVAPSNDGGPRCAAVRLGQACRETRKYPVTVVQAAGGSAMASFPFLGGAVQGRLPLSSAEADMIAARGAYVAEVRLGSYELIDPEHPGSGIACRLDPTIHFYCPVTDRVDQLCYAWTNRRGDP